MRRTISSELTVVFKVIFPLFWIGGLAFGTLLMFIPARFRGAPGTVGEFHEEKWQMLLITALGALALWRTCMPLMRVAFDESSLYVSNLRREIAVPLTEVLEIKENRWINTRPITVRFRSRTELGESIVFMPKTEWAGLFSPHPVIQELQSAVDRSLGMPGSG